MFIREYNIEHRFVQGENIIEFMPERAGRFQYSCWMGMIRSYTTVAEEGEAALAEAEPGLSPSPAGVAIQAENAGLAEFAADCAHGSAG